MDPVSQAVLGSAAAQSLSKKHIVSAGILGCLGGMAPDLDVLIRSSTDPLLFLQYHRHFTHPYWRLNLCAGAASTYWQKARSQF